MSTWALGSALRARFRQRLVALPPHHVFIGNNDHFVRRVASLTPTHIFTFS
jgi:hypothetical protein